eukprot:gene1120-18351_t
MPALVPLHPRTTHRGYHDPSPRTLGKRADRALTAPGDAMRTNQRRSSAEAAPKRRWARARSAGDAWAKRGGQAARAWEGEGVRVGGVTP